MMEYADLDIKPLLLGQKLLELNTNYSHYPVINEVNELIGIVESEGAADEWDDLNLIVNPTLVIKQTSHILSVMMQMKENDLNVLFYVENGIYKGAISYTSIVHYLQDHLNLTRESAIVTMSISHYAFSLSELSRITESEGVKIIYFNSKWSDTKHLEIEVVFDSSDLKRIIGILEHKGYRIIYFYNETGMVDHLKYRYENLISYLNV